MSTEEKYKICPTCGAKNDPRFMECGECGADLMGVRIIDESLEKAAPIENTEDELVAAGFVRICSCGHENPPQLRKCEVCGEDISDILPSGCCNDENNSSCSFLLESIDGQYRFIVPAGRIILGRERELKDYLKSKSYVSRIHAEIDNTQEGLFIRNLSRTNYTYVNNVRVTEEGTILQEGDEIGLGGNFINGSRQENAAYFIVGKV